MALRTARRLRFWGAVIAISLFLIAWLSGVYDHAPPPDPLPDPPPVRNKCRQEASKFFCCETDA